MRKIKPKEKIKNKFLDKDHRVMDTYYMLMEKNVSPTKKRNILKELIEIDPDFYDSYTSLAYLLQEKGEHEAARKILFRAYQRAIVRITDKDGNFPKSLPWLFLSNRHIIRTINAWATELWEQKKNNESLDIFRKLLKSDPNDNIGARHSILAIRLGLKPSFWTKFESKDMPGYVDAFKVGDWFEKENKKFPEEFDWWYKEMEKQEER